MRKHFLARKYSIVTNIFETYVLNQYVMSNKHIYITTIIETFSIKSF